jgi:hypothetical protein
MKKCIAIIVFSVHAVYLFSQPQHHGPPINEAAYTTPFLHCVTTEKYFAKYAVEAHSALFALMDTLKCKFHIPKGLTAVWQEAEKTEKRTGGTFDYSQANSIRIRFNFFCAGRLVSKADKTFPNLNGQSESFTYYFELNPFDTSKRSDSFNLAYQKLLSSGTNGRQLVIQAVLPARDTASSLFFPIVSGSFMVRHDTATYNRWKLQMDRRGAIRSEEGAGGQMVLDYNTRLKYLGDSTMKRIFGEEGFSKNFVLFCLQNPCEKGYTYANMGASERPCSTQPQDSCNEAIVTYTFTKAGVPLIVKMLIAINEAGNKVYIENNHFGKEQISLPRQELLSVEELLRKISRKYPNNSILITADSRSLFYAGKLNMTTETNVSGKQNSTSKKRIVSETAAGKRWNGGFIYVAYENPPNKKQRIFYFDAVTGELLVIFEVYKTIN